MDLSVFIVFIISYIFIVYNKSAYGSSETVYCNGEVDRWTDEVEFMSKNYPSEEINEQTLCQLKIDLSTDDIVIRIDFVDVKMDGQVLTGDVQGTSGCDSDMFIFREFDGWTPPPRCGQLNGYSIVIYQRPIEAMDSLQIVAMMSSRRHFWHLKITKLNKTLDEIRDTTCKRKRGRRSRGVPLISSGEPSSISHSPWQASIRYKVPKFPVRPNYSNIDSEGQHFCGGVIVGERYILTAAHCFYGKSKFVPMKNLTEIKVVLGDSRVDIDDTANESPRYYEIQTVAVHYAYDPYIPVHDVAVIVLKTKIQFIPGLIEMIQLESNDTLIPKEGWVSGYGVWGNSENPDLGYEKSNLFEDKWQSFPFQLQRGKVNLTDECRCLRLEKQIQNRFTVCDVLGQWKYADLFYEICSSSPISDKNATKIGKGDSGGPLVVYKPNKQNQTYPVLHGVILNTKLNRNSSFSSYLNVGSNNEWIASVILSHGDHCDRGVRTMKLFSPEYDRPGSLRRGFINLFLDTVLKPFCGYWVRVLLDSRDNVKDNKSSCGYDWSRTKNFLREKTPSLNSSTFSTNFTLFGQSFASVFNNSEDLVDMLLG